MKRTDESILYKDSLVHLIYHDLSDLALVMLIRIIPKKRTLIIKHVQVNVNSHKKRKKKVENDLTLQLHVRL